VRNSSGSPANDSRLNRPPVSRWISWSTQTICGRNFGIQGWRPTTIASRVIGFMAEA
jgi:hypothetical protein